ncbi:MAG: vWA domain-containing protein [Rickettsiales bacterium]
MIRQLIKHQQGNVLLITGLMVLVLVAFAGASVDLGREQIVKLKMQEAADAAALAAALAPAGATNADKQAVAERYFNINYPAVYLGVPRPRPTIIIGNSIEVTATADVTMNFVSNVGIGQLTANARSVVANGTTVASNYDVLFVLDNSNSMSAADVGSGASRDVPVTRIASVHSDAVAACQAFYAQIAPALGGANPIAYCNNAGDGAGFDASSGSTQLHFGLQGATRLNALRSAAHSLANQLLNGGSGNRVGAISWASQFIDSVPLTSDFASVETFLDRMYALSGTNSTTGLQQAVSMAGGFDPGHVHAVVLITDGYNTQSAPLVNDPSTSTRVSDNRAPICDGFNFCPRTNAESLILCDRLKQSGAQIYTIAFGADVTTGGQATAAQAFLRSCASLGPTGSPNFFIALDANALNGALGTIASSIGKLRIAE